MQPALERLVEANAALDLAHRRLEEALEERRRAALGLADIQDEEERWSAAIWAYSGFGKGLSLALAEAATGLPGPKAQLRFLVRAGRVRHQVAERKAIASPGEREPMREWPMPDDLERELIASHIAHGQAYDVDRGLGWGRLSVSLSPAEANAYLVDPTGVLAVRGGVSRDDFVEWLSSEGELRCEGVTRKGARCKASARGYRGQMTLPTWKAAKARGGYCSAHGG